MEPRLGRADGHRHRVRRRADRDARQAGAGRAAGISHRGVDRRRHRRDHRRGAVLLERAATGAYLAGARGDHRRAGAAQPHGACTARCRTPSLGVALWACSPRGRAARDARRRRAGAVHSHAAAAQPEGAEGAGDRRLRPRKPRAGRDVLRHGPSMPALRALDAIHDRLESPADRTLRAIEPWSSYLVLPLFALANAGVALSTGHVRRDASCWCSAIALGLVVGKPAGFMIVPALAVWAGRRDQARGVLVAPARGRRRARRHRLHDVAVHRRPGVCSTPTISRRRRSRSSWRRSFRAVARGGAAVAAVARGGVGGRSNRRVCCGVRPQRARSPFGVGRGFSLTRRVAAGCSRTHKDRTLPVRLSSILATGRRAPNRGSPRRSP